MRRLFPLSLFATVAVVAACSRKSPQDAAFDSAAAAGVTPEPRNPHVMAFDLGHALDSTGNIFGGVDSRFTPRDSIFISVRAQYAPAGATISARLLRGKTTVDSVSHDLGAPDNSGVATIGLRFGKSGAGWPLGTYAVEVFLNGASQGLKTYDVQSSR